MVYWIGLIAVSIAAFMDYRSTKIKNLLTMPLILLGIIISIFSGSVLSSLLGIVIPFILLYPFWMMGGLGAGDVKLFMAVGSLIGIHELMNYAIVIFMVAAIHAIWIGVREGILTVRFKSFFQHLHTSLLAKNLQGKNKISGDARGKIKLGYSIFLGYIIAMIVFRFAGIDLLV